MLTFDTENVDKRDRADAMASAMMDTTLSTYLAHADPPADVYLRMQTWQLGSTPLIETAVSGITMTRTRKQTEKDDQPVVSLGVITAGGGVQVQNDGAARLTPGTVYAVEMTRPYEHVSTRGTRALTVIMPASDLGLPLEVVQQARTRIAASPVKNVFLEHLNALSREADRLVDTTAATMIEPATLHLARALLASCSDDDSGVRDALADTLLVRVKSYIRRHLQDRNLNAAAIAAAHHVSQRHLYKVCAASQLRLEAWIITQRLEAARADLAKPGSRRLTIASIAAKWGFGNASHFTHRFREAYGMTPRDWQHLRGGPESASPTLRVRRAR